MSDTCCNTMLKVYWQLCRLGTVRHRERTYVYVYDTYNRLCYSYPKFKICLIFGFFKNSSLYAEYCISSSYSF